MADKGFDDLVNTIYESLVDESVLDTVPSALAEYCGARSASLLIWKSPTELEKMLSVSYLPEAFWADYQNGFADKDLWGQRVAMLPPSHAANMEQYVSKRDFLNSEIYNELVHTHGDDTIHCMAAWVPVPNACTATIGLHRGRRAGEFTPRLQQRLQRALPHLRRLATLWLSLGAASRGPKLTEHILDSLAAGVIVLDMAGNIVYCNRTAETILKRHDGLGSQLGLLKADDHDLSVKLQVLVKRIALDPVSESSAALRITRPSGAQPYSLILAPLRQQLTSTAGKVLAVIHDPESSGVVSRKHLEELFGLTHAEAELAAALAEGRSLDEIAAARKVAMSTVRAQTKSVLAKTDTNRQAELVSLVARLPKTR